MYDYIIGKVCSLALDEVTIETNGIGYRISTTSRVIADLQGRDHLVKLYLAFVIREFSHSFFGFLSQEERDLFTALLNVSGVGPKMALSLMNHGPLSELVETVLRKDISSLCKIPGIGKKTAERLLVELKDVLAPFQMQEIRPQHGSHAIRDAISALINLGYSQFAAQQAVKKAVDHYGEASETTLLISQALKEVN